MVTFLPSLYVCRFSINLKVFLSFQVEGTNLESLGPPWKLTVHFGDFPEEAILKCLSRDTIESQFMSCVKEADQFKHGGKIMSTMQKKEHNQLWLGLANGEQFFYTPSIVLTYV